MSLKCALYLHARTGEDKTFVKLWLVHVRVCRFMCDVGIILCTLFGEHLRSTPEKKLQARICTSCIGVWVALCQHASLASRISHTCDPFLFGLNWQNSVDGNPFSRQLILHMCLPIITFACVNNSTPDVAVLGRCPFKQMTLSDHYLTPCLYN